MTAEWTIAKRFTNRALASLRRSEYEAGLDDDGLIDDFLSFAEKGEADQTSVEAQLHGDFEYVEIVVGTHHFDEEGRNSQDPTVFLGFPGQFSLAQELDSTAVFANLSGHLSERWRLGAGVRHTRDRNRATTNVGTGLVGAGRRWDQTSWNLSAHYRIHDRLAAYATLQSGYQSGQFPARPYCLFADPDCFVAGDNITALNHEIGVKGQPRDGLELGATLFHTR